MAASHIESTRAHLSQSRLDPLTHEEGLKLLQQAVIGGGPLTVAASIDLKWLRSYFEDRGGVPALLRSLLGDGRILRNQKGPKLRVSWTVAPTEQRAGILLRMVQETIASALGFSHLDDVDVNRPLQDVGIDSLTAVLVRNNLATLTGLTLSTNFAFLHPNVKVLSNYLLDELQNTCDEGDTSTASSSSLSASSSSGLGTSTPLSTDSPYLNLAAIRKGWLDASLTFDNAAQASTRPESVFVTGSTGFVGAFIVHELLKQCTASCAQTVLTARGNGRQTRSTAMVCGIDNLHQFST